MKPSEFVSVMRPGQEVELVMPIKTKGRWGKITYSGPARRFMETCEASENETDLLDVIFDPDSAAVRMICEPKEEE